MTVDQHTESREQLRRAVGRPTSTYTPSGDGSDPTEAYLAVHKARIARERAACRAFHAGMPINEIAHELKLEPIAIYRILQRYATTEGLGSP